MEQQNAFDRIADRAALLAIATRERDTKLAATIIEDELDLLTIDSIRYWSRCAPTPANTDAAGHLVPPVLLKDFVIYAARKSKKRKRRYR